MTQLDERWAVSELPAGCRPSHELVRDVLLGRSPGFVMPAVLTDDECARVCDLVAKESGSSYEAIQLTWASPVDVPAHWEIKYAKGHWLENIASADALDAYVELVFSGLSPRRLIENALGNWALGPVQPFVHPLYGARVAAGQLRRGAPRAHVDDANYDIDGVVSLGQIGINLILSNPEEADLTVYNAVVNGSGQHHEAGAAVVGNYDLPRAIFEHAASARLACRTGSIVVVSNRFIHEVDQVMHPRERLTYAMHAMWQLDGTLALFS